MTPEERSLIDGLFDRMRSAAGQPRDREAEALIARRVAEMPYAAYVLAQTVLVQDHALQQANVRIQQLEAEIAQAQRGQQQDVGAQGGGFLGGLFGGGRGTSVPNSGSRGPMPLPQQSSGYTSPGYAPPQGGGYTAPGYQQGGYPPAAGGYPAAGPWGQQRGGGFGGGGFLQGALATAAGVAGGALLYDGIRNLMSGGSGPIADQAALMDPAQAQPAAGDLGQQAQDALGGDVGAGGDPWGAGPQDASYEDNGGDDGGWDAGGGDDSSWT